MPRGGQVGLVEEDPAEVLAVGEHLVLHRQERAAGVDEVDARQPVVGGDLLRAQVLLDRDRVVGAALDGRVVGDDHALAAADPADAGDDAGAGHGVAAVRVAVHPGRGQRAELEERAAGVEQPVDPVADQQLAAVGVLRPGGLAAAPADDGQPLAQLVDERLHLLAHPVRLAIVNLACPPPGMPGMPRAAFSSTDWTPHDATEQHMSTHRPRSRELRVHRQGQRHRLRGLLGELVRPVPAVRAGLRAGLRGQPRPGLRQRRTPRRSGSSPAPPRITSIPTLMAFKEGALVFAQPGALPPDGAHQADRRRPRARHGRGARQPRGRERLSAPDGAALANANLGG